MIELATLPINSTAAITGARNRVRFLAEDLEFDVFAATRLAAMTSNLCRTLYHQGDEASITIGIGKSQQAFNLQMVFSGQRNPLTSNDAGKLFDRAYPLELKNGLEGFAVVKRIPSRDFDPSERFIVDQRERLVRLSKAELLEEVQQRNDELTALLDEVKLHAEREKELAAAAAVAEVERREARELEKAYRKLAKAHEHEQRLANYDAITGLPNRTCFEDRVTQAIERAEREQQTLAVMFLDLDHFKNVNDTVGHAEGDQLLREVSERLLGCVRKSDTVARLGGDEFTLALMNIAHPEVAAEVARNILTSIAQPFLVGGREFYIGSSIGIAVYPDDGHTVDLLLRNADTAMYEVKKLGRNNHQFYSADMNAQAKARLDLENSLRKAVKHEQLSLHYQPQIDCSTGKIVSMEALLRWPHEGNHFMPLEQFIPLAEETGLIVDIGHWVLREACSQNKAWQEAGYAPIPVAVNLSMRQFEQSDLADDIMQILEETGLEPRWLELELTEGVFLHHVESARAMLTSLKQAGVIISIDDFGTGYSSLSQLRRLPIDTIKVDCAFSQGVIDDPDDAAIVSSIIVLAHNLNLKVIAEGVETEAQLEFLRENGCDLWQGFLFSKALPADQFEALLRERLLSRSKAQSAAEKLPSTQRQAGVVG
ncbi:putative bifunctional diguanylate cyclase/phosphodiesterase [Marinobacter fonticola]|uniref:putative bifunctional diguanylate cyclase/phosphodiesterase n=1 Tax=Marinobacter fonticola TaxID=2603215 RepID=UPI0011E7FD89|nr:EAL domain-containing protein [Marinobacter fonticola]